ncbi:Rhodanese-related sulfurtransferase [Epibacterium ulvae]|uniref:Rhodanese-related sulfurtransferase n=1 Tax=Epibacterium ulvae TaxID=1156985 RepID=A0A1G5Q1J1_9RHOB|nr:rhodanese-like domain-containing protein [Epibacterium ulvae]SCZ55179.1 Rhodanese-related sulfurtransferase [Epibacterium ulvae]
MSTSTLRRPHLNRRRLLLVGLGIGGAVAVGRWRYLTAPEHLNAKLSVQETHTRQKTGEITLVDIRTPREWAATGIAEGAHPIDMRRDDFVEALQGVVGENRSAPIALICARGVRSARMTIRLSEAGFNNIIDVPEGMLGSKAGPGWINSNLPVVR